MNGWLRAVAIALSSTLALPVASVAQPPRLAVVDFDVTGRYQRQAANQLAQLIQDRLVNTGLFSVVEREKLRSILREQGLSGSGLVDPSTAVKMGRLLGASYLMTGRIISADAETRDFQGYGVQSRSTIHTLKARVKILDASSGQVLFSGVETAESQQTEAGGLRIDDRTVYADLAEELASQFAARISTSGQFRAEEPDQPELVAVTITSSPEKADVEVDGVFYGNAGSKLQLPAGLHEVKVSLPGYLPWQKRVMLRDGLTMHARLEKKTDMRIEIEQKQTQ